MLFDVGSTELPVATMRTRKPLTVIALDLRTWFIARWLWLRPRTIPVLVAMIGMVCVLESVSYLSRVPAAPGDTVAPPVAEIVIADGSIDSGLIVGIPANASEVPASAPRQSQAGCHLHPRDRRH